MSQVEIVIARDFSRTPTGRYKSDGQHSAETFRRTILGPALLDNEVVTIVLDGVLGFGSSFLEEAFGGLIRDGFSKEVVLNRLNLISDDDSFLVDEIVTYIKESK